MSRRQIPMYLERGLYLVPSFLYTILPFLLSRCLEPLPSKAATFPKKLKLPAQENQKAWACSFAQSVAF
jgi:hypothetical protein